MKAIFKCKGQDIFYLKHLDKDIFKTMSNNIVSSYTKTGELKSNGQGTVIYESFGYSSVNIKFDGSTNVYMDRENKDVYSMYVNDQLVLNGSNTVAYGTWQSGYGLDYKAHAEITLQLDPTVLSKIVIRGQQDSVYAKESSRMSYEVTFS